MTNSAKNINGDLSRLVTIDAIPQLIMHRMMEINTTSEALSNLKLFAAPDEASIQEVADSLTISPGDHPLIQVMKKTAQTYYKCKSDQIQRELLSELRSQIDSHFKCQMETLREANKLLIEYAKIKTKIKSSGDSMGELLEAIKGIK